MSLIKGLIEAESSGYGDETNEFCGAISTRLTSTFAAGDTTANVETTLGWPDEGQFFIDGVRYMYGSKTLTSFIDVVQVENSGSVGWLELLSGLQHVDGETVVIPDADGNVVTIELDKNDIVAPGNVQIPITNLMQPRDVAKAVVDALNLRTVTLNVEVILIHDHDGRGIVGLRSTTPGPTGDIEITHTVADAAFRAIGMLGGSLMPAGAMQDHRPLAEVIDFSRQYSGVDTMRRATQVAYATGDDLSIVGRNVSIKRPVGCDDDEIYRKLIENLAYSPRGTMQCLELALDALFGEDGWETFENLTGSLASPRGERVRNRNTVYVRQRDEGELSYLGKAFLDGDVTGVSTTDITATLVDEPLLIGDLQAISVRLADDPSCRCVRFDTDRGAEDLGRLVDYGDSATSIDGGRTVSAVGNNLFEAHRGDLFMLLSGRLAGTMATVETESDGTFIKLVTQADVGDTPSLVLLSIDESFSGARWALVRPSTNCRWWHPTNDQSIEYVGGPSVQQWAFDGDDLSDATLETLLGRFLNIDLTAPHTKARFTRSVRITQFSNASFSLVAHIGGAFAGAGAGLGAVMRMTDGTREIAVGAWKDTGSDYIGFIDAAGDPLPSGTPILVNLLASWCRFEIVKNGRGYAQFFADGRLIDQVPYIDLELSADRMLTFGSEAVGGSLWVKEADWHIESDRDYMNWHVYQPIGETNSVDHIVDNGVTLGLTDPTHLGKLVTVHDFGLLNALGGNARGAWEIAEIIGPLEARVVGVTKTRAGFEGPYPRRVTLRGDLEALAWPDALGHSIEILSGPNAGTYQITKMLDPDGLTDFALAYPEYASQLVAPPGGWPGSAAGLPLTLWTNVIEIDADLPDPSDDTEVNWRLVPNFPDDIDVEFEVGVIGTVTGSDVQMYAPGLPEIGENLIQVEYSTVRSAVLEDEKTKNTLIGSGEYTNYPFYLYDAFGYARDVLWNIARAAGYFIDVDSLMRDQESYPDPDTSVNGLQIVED